MGKLLRAMLVFLTLVGTNVSAMTFRLVEDPCGGGNANSCAPRIFGTGPITIGDDLRLRSIVGAMKGKPLSGVTLSSPGGSLHAGLLLGFEIRRLRLDTFAVASMSSWTRNAAKGSATPDVETILEPRVTCLSACAYAFLGGLIRTAETGAVLGFHRFALTQPNVGAEQGAQVTMMVLRTYLQANGVDEDLLTIASLTASQDMSILTEQQLREMRVSNTEPLPKAWTVTALADGTPVLRALTYLPGGRAVSMTLRQTGNLIHSRIEIAIPEHVVSAERLAAFPVGEKTNVTFANVSGRTLEPWRKAVVHGGVILTVDVAFDASAVQRLTTRDRELLLNDGYSGRALSDVGLLDAPMASQGLGNGLRLIGRVR